VSILPHQLDKAFFDALQLELSPERPTIVSIAHAGNWKALYPAIQEKLPKLQLSFGARYPVVIGGEDLFYLKQTGAAGAVEFKQSVRRLLRDHERILVFETQKIRLLLSNPACIGDFMMPGHSATLFFRDIVDSRIAGYLARQKGSINWRTQTISPSSISVLVTELSAGIVREEFTQVAAIVTVDERETLDAMRGELLESVAPEVEDHFLEDSFGVPKLREFARRKIAIALLRITIPSYSLKSGRDPIEFFREHLYDKFIRHDLPVGYVSEVSPNLSFVVKSQKRFSELRLG
jgi:hypothetical protein